MQYEVYPIDGTSWLGILFGIVSPLLLLSMTSFAIRTLIRNRRRGGSV